MLHRNVPVAENGRVSNGNIGNYKIPKRNSTDTNANSNQNFDEKVPATQKPVSQNASAPTAKFNSAPAPMNNHGFVHNQPETFGAKADYYKCAEAKRAPSSNPDEPLKDLTPMQQELEKHLPAVANFATLPAKLSEKFSLGTCDLCKVNMLSINQTQMHYNGKPHMKKVRAFLVKECGKTDEPPVKVAKENVEEMKKEENRECKICKVIFNSSVHANSHYQGKKHKKALVNHARSGVTADGRFGIGSDFSSATPTGTAKPAVSISKPYFCELCNVQASSSEQYKTHVEGARHAKNLRKINGNNPPAPVLGFVDDSEAFAMFRTPSGKFYCHYCNHNANTRKNFASHVKTDSHGANEKKYKQTQSKADVTGFDLTDDEYISKYEDY